MDTIIQAIRQYTEGMLTRDEMDEKLTEKDIHGAVSGLDFTGYDYHNQAWVRIHLS